MKKHIENYDVFKETISQNNVLAMAEQLAMYETRFLIGYMGSRMQKIYADLCVDIKRKNDISQKSEAYAQSEPARLELFLHFHIRFCLAYGRNFSQETKQLFQAFIMS